MAMEQLSYDTMSQLYRSRSIVILNGTIQFIFGCIYRPPATPPPSYSPDAALYFYPTATTRKQVFPAQDMDGKMFFPKPPPKRQLANPIALAALVDLLASEEEAVLHPALTLLVTVVRGGLEIPLSAGARGRIVVRCLRHACEGRCAELCAELLGAEAVAAPPARLSDGGMGGAGKATEFFRSTVVHYYELLALV